MKIPCELIEIESKIGLERVCKQHENRNLK
jgi:hypothetical protein